MNETVGLKSYKINAYNTFKLMAQVLVEYDGLKILQMGKPLLNFSIPYLHWLIKLNIKMEIV